MKTCLILATLLLSGNCQNLEGAKTTVPAKRGEDYNIRDCWECMDDGGRICHNKDYQNMFQDTQSSNTANGICCTSDASTGYCAPNNGAQVCSMKSKDDQLSKYKDVLTSSTNYQMFAFCPMDSNTKCGVNKTTQAGVPDTNLVATKSKQYVSSSEMKYVKGASS